MGRPGATAARADEAPRSLAEGHASEEAARSSERGHSRGPVRTLSPRTAHHAPTRRGRLLAMQQARYGPEDAEIPAAPGARV